MPNNMSTSEALSTKARFFVLRCTPPAREGVIVKRKKGYLSFLQQANADKMAARLSANNPGARFYVLKSVTGHLLPKAVTAQTASY